MTKIRVISNQEAMSVLRMSAAIAGVEQAYAQKCDGTACVFPMVFHAFEPGVADMDIKSGAVQGSGVFGLKLVSWFGENEAKGLPALFGTNLIMDLETGAPKALLNGTHITHMRTGAAGAVGAKYLARADSQTLLMVGMGELAAYEIAAVLTAMEQIKTVYVINPHHPAGMETRLERIRADVAKLLSMESRTEDYSIVLSEDLASAASKADVIITATPARDGFLKKEWIRPGTHISCIGADMEGKNEVDAALCKTARLFADDIRQSVTVGELQTAIGKGYCPESSITELGNVILGRVAGRTGSDEITIFDSTGIALQDLIVSAKVVQAAEAANLGVVCDFG